MVYIIVHLFFLYFIERPCLPPEPIDCADVPRMENQNLKIKKQGKTIYLAGARLKYVSRSGYMLDGPLEITCSMGNWTTAPICLGNIKPYFFFEVHLAIKLKQF